MTVTAIDVPVDGPVPAGATNAYLIGDRGALLVDPAARTERLDAGVDERRVAHVAVTHAHPDHVGAIASYADRTGATVWARRGREARFERAAGRPPDRTFAPGETVPAGDGSVTVLEAGGHAPDHVAFVADDGVLCGDLAVAAGSVAVGADDGDMRAYVTSLRRLYAMDPPALYPGHGPRIDDPRATLGRLLRHRREREQRVLAAVRDGASTPDAVLEAAYDADLTGVRALARATVVAHLRKLDVEGRVVWNPADERVGVPGAD